MHRASSRGSSAYRCAHWTTSEYAATAHDHHRDRIDKQVEIIPVDDFDL
ncbi:MAG: hypothetical protein E7E09_10075 [Winkia neuii]|nr:hypothetical protein [Winkia neuii]